MASVNNVLISCADTDCGTFLGHLKEALRLRDIKYSEVGKGTGETKSGISVVILSENYASFEPNLRHLVKLGRKREWHTILPVFFHLHSYDVVNHGGNFAPVFDRSTQNLNEKDVSTCKNVLKEVCYMFGWNAPYNCDEVQLAGNIADEVKERTTRLIRAYHIQKTGKSTIVYFITPKHDRRESISLWRRFREKLLAFVEIALPSLKGGCCARHCWR